MSVEAREKCGVIAVEGVSPNAAYETLQGLQAVQNRGQDSSGLAYWIGDFAVAIKGEGLVRDIYNPFEIRNLRARRAIGHDRYATSGGNSFYHCQPVERCDGTFILVHNGNIPNISYYRNRMRQRGIQVEGKNDSEMMTDLIHDEWIGGRKLDEAIAEVLSKTEGAVSAVVQTPDQTAAFRDRWGIRPLCIGQLSDGGMVFASETHALDAMGAKYIRAVKQGEIVVAQRSRFSGEVKLQSRLLDNRSDDEQIDVFEPTYFMHRLSKLNGRFVWQMRMLMGMALADEHPISADVVMGVPDSALDAARGYSLKSGIPFRMGLLKDPESGRTFIQASEEIREKAARMKYILNPYDPDVVKGKKVIVIDDSIVRGLTSRVIVEILREFGAAEVTFLSHSPRYEACDYLGIATTSLNELVAHDRRDDEIRDFIGADKLGYLSLESLIRATGRSRRRLSSHVFTGEYPFPINSQELQSAAGVY